MTSPGDLEQQVLELQRQVRVLQGTIALWRLNGLSVLDSGNLFAGKDGLYGTGVNSARVDHSH